MSPRTPEERAAYARAYYRENADKIRNRVKDYRTEHLEMVRAKDRARGFREPDPRKTFARNLVNRAITRGDLVRGDCERCGVPEAQAHHDDYSRPLDIRWLCRTCHGVEHRTVAP